MRKIIFLFVFFLCYSLLSAQPATKQSAGKRPNVILFLVDDLGFMDVGYNGSSFYETPNIDKFAKEGVKFNQAYAACHVCSPTRASILTGKSPARLNLTDWIPGRKDYPFQQLKNAKINQQLPYEEQSLPEYLRQNGYATAIFGKWHLGDSSSPTKHGFDMHEPAGWHKGWPLSFYAPFNLQGYNGNEGEYLTDRLTTDALSFIEKNKNKPFFLYMSHFAVHDPIEGRSDLVKKYENKLKQMPKQGAPFTLEGNPDTSHPYTSEQLAAMSAQQEYQGYSQLPNRMVKIKQRQDNVQFAAMVDNMDENFGRVMAKLKELGIADNTIVIFASDNGGMSGANFGKPDKKIGEAGLNKQFSTSNLPLRGAKGWLYEGGIRIPLIIYWPGGGINGFTSNTPVITTDFYPTVLDMIGLPMQPQQHKDGVSLVSQLKGKDDTNHPPLFWHFPHYSNHGSQSPGAAVRLGDYKLLEYFEKGNIQLFNLKNDPNEQHDLSKKEPETAKKLLQMLHQWQKDVNAQKMKPNPDYSSN